MSARARLVRHHAPGLEHDVHDLGRVVINGQDVDLDPPDVRFECRPATRMRVRVSSRVARRLMRFELDRLCAKAGVTHAEMGARLGVSRASFSQAVAGRNLLSRPALEVVAAHLGAMERLPWLIELWTIARPPPGPAMRPLDHELALGLEAVATRITVYDPLAVTPLVQTARYARELVDAAHAEDVVRRRGTVTGPEPAEVEYIADETALRKVVGGASTMVEQYDHLVAMSERPNVTVRVVPAGLRPQRTGAFQLLCTQDVTVACQETRWSACYYSEPNAVADYRALLDELRERAHTPERSRDLLVGLRAATVRNTDVSREGEHGHDRRV